MGEKEKKKTSPSRAPSSIISKQLLNIYDQTLVPEPKEADRKAGALSFRPERHTGYQHTFIVMYKEVSWPARGWQVESRTRYPLSRALPKGGISLQIPDSTSSLHVLLFLPACPWTAGSPSKSLSTLSHTTSMFLSLLSEVFPDCSKQK